ncbi:hypothetical protein [Frankia sp. Cr1]|uniref:hypothetical protein n=1 Tax=Frankia sp. Cr1 TaxID=3073931 RepID=UPI002AD24FD5|nr:hypothetical protein [Frankia sp. Cr1]
MAGALRARRLGRVLGLARPAAARASVAATPGRDTALRTVIEHFPATAASVPAARSPQVASGWANQQPGVDYWVLPTAWAEGNDWAVIGLESRLRPTRAIAQFGSPQAADRHARASRLSNYTVVPVDVYTPEPASAGT